MMGHVFSRRLLLLSGILSVLAAISWGVGSQILNRPASDSLSRRIVDIPQGSSLRQVATQLQDKGLLRHDWVFTWMGRLSGNERNIIPGEYELYTSMRPTEILSTLVEGRLLTYPVTIPEGYTVLQIAELLERKGLANRDAFLRLTQDRAFIHQLQLNVPSLEGYLFPDTYFFRRHTSSEALIATMVKRARSILSPLVRERAKELTMTVQEILTLASVIEKETGISQERALVSGVFHNRLRKNIPLQSDPTVIYALEHFDGDLRKRDLAVKSPYNTYYVKGLPPGPICNPGQAAIHAALYPAPTKFVYFVARQDGSHQFSVTLAEHNKAVHKYQRGSHS